MPKRRVLKQAAIRRTKRMNLEKEFSEPDTETEEEDFDFESDSSKGEDNNISESVTDEDDLMPRTPEFVQIKDEPADDMQYELVQNYTNQYFFIPLEQENEQTKKDLSSCYVVMKEQQNTMRKNLMANADKNITSHKSTVGILKHKKHKKQEQKKKIFRPPTPDLNEDIVPIMKPSSGAKQTEVACNKTSHLVDVFSIFGKSVGDQLRSFPMDRAIALQNKIQDLITEERFKL